METVVGSPGGESHDHGGQAHFAQLYDEHYSSLVSYCRHLVAAHDEAEDLAQETFGRAWASWHRYAPDLPFWPWVATMARRIAIDRRRRAALGERRRHIEAALHAHVPARPDDLAEDADEGRIAMEALRELRPNHRRLISLKDIEGWSYEDIATFEGVTVESVRGSLRRARHTLRRGYERLASGAPVVLVWRWLRRGTPKATQAMARLEAAWGLSPAAWCRLWDAAAAVVAVSLAAGTPVPGVDRQALLPAGAPLSVPSRPADAAAPSDETVGAPAPLGRPGRQDRPLPAGWTTAAAGPTSRLFDTAATPEDAEFSDFTASPRYADDGIVFGVGAGRSGCVQECPVLFRSVDGGGSWERMEAVGFQGGRIMLPPAFPTDSRVFAGGPAGLQVSVDGGRSFRTVVPVAGPMFMSPEFSGRDPRIIVGTAPGWEYRDDLGAAVPLTFTPPPANVGPTFTVAFSPSYVADGVFYLGGASARPPNPAQASSVSRCAGSACDVPVVFPGSVGAPNLLTTGSTVYAWRPQSLFASSDGGRAFTPLRLPGAGRLASLAADTDGTLYAVTENRETTALYTSDDGGRSWQVATPAAPPGLRKVAALADGTLLSAPSAGAGGGIVCSRDGGATWARRCTT